MLIVEKTVESVENLPGLLFSPSGRPCPADFALPRGRREENTARSAQKLYAIGKQTVQVRCGHS